MCICSAACCSILAKLSKAPYNCLQSMTPISSYLCTYISSRDSIVGIVTRLWDWWSEVWIKQGQEIFHFSKMSRLALGSTQPPIQSTMGTLCPWVKRLVHEANQSPPSSVKVKNEWNLTFTPPYALVACPGQISTFLPLSLCIHNVQSVYVKSESSWT